MKPSAPALRNSVPMRVVGDTCGLARKDQYAYWLESVGGQAAHWNAERKNPAAGFRGRSHHARIGAILIWENHNDPYRIWRSPTRSPDSSGEWLYLASSNVEAFATGETKRRFAPNELVFIDTRRPVTLSNSRYARTRYLAIPRSALPASIGATLFPSLDTITPSRPLGRMIHS
ncbi:MAG: hypothetical protein ACRESG_07995, partial [Gammaproteobacteria bacterium]